MIRRCPLLGLVVAVAFAWCPVSVRAAAYGSASDFAPAHVAELLDRWKTLCVVRFTCPVPDELYNHVKGAISGGSPDQVSLATDLEGGRNGAPRDLAVAGMWFALAAQQGNAYAVKKVMQLQKNGLDVEVDYEKVAAALTALVKRADDYSVYAMRALGPMYILGRGVPRDIAEGLRLLRAAADAGDLETIQYMADMYGLGMPGIAVDRNEQVRWLVRLAEHGRADVMGQVGRMMTNPPITLFAAGRPGTPGVLPDRNVAEGYRWLMRGALMGNAGAQTELGQLLMNGLNVDGAQVIAPDLMQADMWFRLTANSPYYSNNVFRTNIEQRLTSAEIDEVRKRVAAFAPVPFGEVMKRQIDLPPAGAARSGR